MRILRRLVIVLACLASAYPAAAEQAARVGLFIGNANYPDANSPLGAPIKDAQALAGEFRRFGFEIEIKENVAKDEMQRAIDAFLAKITSETAAVLYFGGYGLQVARQNYLVPVNAQIWSENDVKRDGISLESIVAEMNRKGARVKIIIVDAAYRNPFERRFREVPAGLAALETPPGTLVIYSVALGRVINGTTEGNLLASELIKELRVPGRSAEVIFNDTRRGVSRASTNGQIPWVASSLAEDFFFAEPRTAARPSSEPARTPAPPPAPFPTVIGEPAPILQPAPTPAPPTPLPPAALPTLPAPAQPTAPAGRRPPGSIKALFERHGLLGTFAWDCSKPVNASTNWYFVNRLLSDDRVQRDLMVGPDKRQFVVFLDHGEELNANEVFVSGTRDGQPIDGVWRVESGRMLQWQSSRAGRKEIVDGKMLATGVKLPWLYKCGT